jgi:hypothetical protein
VESETEERNELLFLFQTMTAEICFPGIGIAKRHLYRLTCADSHRHMAISECRTLHEHARYKNISRMLEECKHLMTPNTNN